MTQFEQQRNFVLFLLAIIDIFLGIIMISTNHLVGGVLSFAYAFLLSLGIKGD